jgi:hypothetical protein
MATTDKTTAPAETEAVETETPVKESKARQGKQLSAIVYEPELIEDLELIKTARRIGSPSDLVRAALTEFAANHQDDAERARQFFALAE